MKKIFTDNNLTHCDMVKAILNEEGIDVFLKNENICNTAGGSIVGALGFAWPEIWVLNDDSYDRAIKCLQESDLSFISNE